ncbi:site-specific integrase [Gordonia amicalis]|uniref:Site-specific integrase n=1 Tax=Gordonia amicalis TaxID=89053 RepID=A0AAE4U1U7_9ACTN|nr:site-specific integrase [Gordonia amicalis]MDV6309700.1 site-specific integrase [Gordonia amicalis]MDV6314389.1 site-specific integrase [Gordonia amicalis]MDV7102261.1 site-specific integrase [Gordonia amicalis]
MPQKKPATATRSRRGFGRLRQRGSGRWQASYLHHGQLHYAPATFPTKDSGSSWLQNERDLIDLDRRKPGTWTPPAERVTKAAARKLTLRDYAKPWLQHRTLSPRTRDNYEYHLERNILPTLGDSALAEITPEDVRVWFTGLGTEHRTRNAQAYGVLQAVMNTATDDGLIDRSPARIKGAAAVKHTKRSVVLLEPDELAALADKMPEALRLTVLLAGWCGLRRGELFALTRADVADDAATVRVSKAVTFRHGKFEAGPTKTKESNRTVTVPPHLRPIIAAHLREHVGEAKTALLFADPVTGSYYAEGRYRTPFFHARQAIGKGELHFHDLRHCGGVLVAQTGATLKEVMARLGHTTPGTAMRYQHVAAGRADMIADRLSALAVPAVSGDAPAAG